MEPGPNINTERVSVGWTLSVSLGTLIATMGVITPLLVFFSRQTDGDAILAPVFAALAVVGGIEITAGLMWMRACGRSRKAMAGAAACAALAIVVSAYLIETPILNFAVVLCPAPGVFCPMLMVTLPCVVIVLFQEEQIRRG